MRFLDITRLSKRAESARPTGVDRVDLAYLEWLRGIGSTEYLMNWVGGFLPIDERLGNAFAGKLKDVWDGEASGFTYQQLKPFRKRASRLRSAAKWQKRLATVKKLGEVGSLEQVCQSHLEELDAADASTSYQGFKVDRAWRGGVKHSGVYFGISHSMLGRTQYLKTLAAHEDLKRVFFIHDTIPCDFPEYCRDGEALRHLLKIRNAYRYGTHLIVNSNYTRDRLDYWRGVMGLPELPVAVISIGAELDAMGDHAPSGVSESEHPYFVVLGTVEPRKNHMLLLQVWRHFAETLPKEQIPKLKIIGRYGWENEAVNRMLDRCGNIAPHVEKFDRVQDQELWPLLSGARALLFPSFVEGWGMPLVEAMSMKVPVIASDIPAFHEAGQGFAELLSPIDGSAWASAILDYADPSSSRRIAQQQKIEGFRPPTWEEQFSQVERFIGPGALTDQA